MCTDAGFEQPAYGAETEKGPHIDKCERPPVAMIVYVWRGVASIIPPLRSVAATEANVVECLTRGRERVIDGNCSI